MHTKGIIMDHAQNETNFFDKKKQKQIISFHKLFILSKHHMFWLSFESFSILGDAAVGYASIEKFNTLMIIPKPMTVKNYNKTVSRIKSC